jgi:integrase
MAHGSVDGAAMTETCAFLRGPEGTLRYWRHKGCGPRSFKAGCHDNAITWRWRATRTSAGRGHVRLHDLRHFYASGVIAAGCDVVTVQRALGHSTATTTLNTYSHLWPTAADRTRKVAAGLMRQALEVTRRPDRESRQRRLAETGSTR